MHKELMDILVCPVCKGKLELKIEKQDNDEIVAGALYCERCQVSYPITETIPTMLPPDRRN